MRCPISVFLCVLVLPINLRAADPPTGQWPVFRGPNRDGISSETRWTSQWQAPPKQLWKAGVGEGYSSITVSAGRAYTLGNSKDVDTVFCLDARTGQVIWKHSYAAPLLGKVKPDVPGPRATPTIDGDRVYTISRDGQLFCFDAAGGKVVWSRNLGQDPQIVMPVWGFSGSPLVIGDTLLIHANLAGVALNKSTGNIRWISEKAEAGFDTPAIFQREGKLRMAALAADRIVFADASNGQVLWTHPWKTSFKENTPDVIWSDGKLFVSTGYSQGCILLDAASEKPRVVYQNRDLRTHIASSILYRKHIYGLDEAGATSGPLRCMEFETGRILWTSSESHFANLMLADGKLILITERGELVTALASPDKYTELARAHVIGGQNWTIPVLCDGLVYVRNSAGDIVCLDLRQ